MDNFPDNKKNDNNIDLAKVLPATELNGPMQDSIGDRASEVSLDDAYKAKNNDGSYEIQTPLTAAELAPKSRNRLFLKLGALGATVFLAAGAVFVGVNSGGNAPPKSDPVAEAGVDSSGAKVPVEAEPLVEAETPVEAPVISINDNDPAITAENETAILESLRFTPDLDGQAVGEKFSSTINRWSSAGATSETFYAWLEAGTPDVETYAGEIAKNNTHVYATALFGEDYASNPYVSDYVKGVEKSNAATIFGLILTYGDKNIPNSNSVNKEPLLVKVTALSVTVESESEEKLIVVVQQKVEVNDENTMFAGKLPADGHLSNTYIGLIKDPNIDGNRIISTLDINDIN